MIARVLLILFIFVIPIILLLTRLVPASRKTTVLAAAFFASVGASLGLKTSSYDLGIRWDNLQETFFPYLTFTVIALGIIILIAKIFKRKPQKNWQQDSHFLYLFIPISIAQEFLFRGFLISQLKNISLSIAAIIIISTVLFTLVHLIYPPLKISIPLGIISGLAFTGMYLAFPNLILLSLSHSILNFLAVLYGFFNNEYESTT